MRHVKEELARGDPTGTTRPEDLALRPAAPEGAPGPAPAPLGDEERVGGALRELEVCQ